MNKDEKNQIITTNCWLTMVIIIMSIIIKNISIINIFKFWLDNKLSWNESDYNGISEIRLPHDKVWKPVSIKTSIKDIQIRLLRDSRM